MPLFKFSKKLVHELPNFCFIPINFYQLLWAFEERIIIFGL